MHGCFAAHTRLARRSEARHARSCKPTQAGQPVSAVEQQPAARLELEGAVDASTELGAESAVEAVRDQLSR